MKDRRSAYVRATVGNLPSEQGLKLPHLRTGFTATHILPSGIFHQNKD